jgi:hydrogenase maturation protein HypF
MCERCRAEYENPHDRRFHAQPNACPECGPQLALWDGQGACLVRGRAALDGALERIAAGRIVAVKGVGGFHLMADARDDRTVRLLRARKRREQKPLALMVPSLEAAQLLCQISPLESDLLSSAAAPIVLLRARRDSGLSPLVAPENPYLGVMLPYTPLHHLLLRALGGPVVATSGNIADEPICIDEGEALRRLAGIADSFLVHDRPIARQIDDSVVRVIGGIETVLRRSRGYAPLHIAHGAPLPDVIALGGHLKNTIAMAKNSEILVSQHIGDLDSAPARDAFEGAVGALTGLRDGRSGAIACDLHPDYASTMAARRLTGRTIPVQHHHAHVFSCMVDNGITAPLLGVAWDGAGLGEDGTIWGGEFFLVGDDGAPERVAHLRRFPLPGGDQAAREPRRAALGLAYEIFGAAVFARGIFPRRFFAAGEIRALEAMLARRLQAPLASSVGRLFDAVASLLGLAPSRCYEGQAAMALEFAADGYPTGESYPLPLIDGGKGRPLVLDWEPMVRAVLRDRDRGVANGKIAARFHNALADGVVAVARRVKQEKIALSGGCFQNRLLAERVVEKLTDAGFRAFRHRRIPPNDGGLAVGQVLGAARILKSE